MGLCFLGALSALAMMLGLFPRFAAVLCWFGYLSLVSPSRVFLNFQWDVLILEAGFLAILFVPSRRVGWLGLDSALARIGLGLLRWLLFRLMWTSGLVKLVGGDAAWWDLSALRFHFETQPLPPWTAWLSHHVVSEVDLLGRVAVGLMFFVELVVPAMIFAPRRLRVCAFWPLALLQLGIIVTGNYGFFNWLTLVLTLTVLDDQALQRVPRLGRAVLAMVVLPTPRLSRRLNVARTCGVAVAVVLATLLVANSTGQMVSRLGGARVLPAAVFRLNDALAPWRLTSSYGLFTSMTKTRPEIVLEGSYDGQSWSAYEFHYKPGDLSRRPRFVAHHQPRLDWQMWFAALSDYRRQPWVARLQGQLLDGSPQALSLLAVNPFPDRPPRHLRAVLYDYRFAPITDHDEDGRWWVREPLGLWSPVMSRHAGE